MLRLVDSRGRQIGTNDDWQVTGPDPNPQRAEIMASHLAPSDARESAIIATLDPGAYTALETDRYGNVGPGLIEAYDLDTNSKSVLVNLSTRGVVRSEDAVMIGGVILTGPGHTGGRLLVRALGPSLVNLGIATPLRDPTLQLYNADGVSLAFNDNWRDTQATEITAIGLPPTNLLESAILINRPPGPMTAVVRSRDPSNIGIGLVEVYDIP
jgi:hypothetical protein